LSNVYGHSVLIDGLISPLTNATLGPNDSLGTSNPMIQNAQDINIPDAPF